jgi:tRNA pseudouridine55 synthase
MSALRRTRSAGFSLRDAHTLEEVEAAGAEKLLIPPERILDGLPILTPPDFFMQLLLHGQWVDGAKFGASQEKYRLYGENGFIGLLSRQDEKYGLVWRL